MPPRSSNWRMYAKMFMGGSILCIGGPALVYYVSPTEEALFQRYNPELQKKSLENRIGKQQDFDHFVGKLKEYSKSDKPIWVAAAAADERNRRERKSREQEKLIDEMTKRKEAMRGEVKGVPGGSL